jgi:hypothetical protein
MTRRTFLALPLTALLTKSAGAAFGAVSRGFVIVVARPDGHLVPFAGYDGRLWSRTWSDARDWNVWRASAASPVTARVTGVNAVPSHCEELRALATDLPPVPTPPHTFPLELGVAVDADLPAGALRRIVEIPPLAAVHVDGRRFWVLQELGYQSETWVIAEVQPAAVRYVLEVNGGGC